MPARRPCVFVGIDEKDEVLSGLTSISTGRVVASPSGTAWLCSRMT